MSQVLPAESLPETSPNQPCSPVVQAVLSCLDVQLTEELTRYRRKRPVKQVRQGRAAKATREQKPLDLISVKARESETSVSNPHLTPESLVEPKEVAQPTLSSINLEQSSQESSLTGKVPISEETSPESTNPGFANPFATTTLTDEYLETAQARLSNLTQEEEPAESQASPETNKLLTPLGIGSMLLLLVGTATLGYVAMNPSTIRHLSANKAANSGESKVAELNSGNLSGEIANSPNLADREFVELNLKSLSTINPKGVAASQSNGGVSKPQLPVNAPAPLPTPVTPSSNTLDLPSALIPPSIQSGVLPPPFPKTPPTVAPTLANKPNVAVTTKAQTTKAISAKEARFLVIVAYNGDRSLQQARKVIPNALVRETKQGKAIQLAAFPDELAAQKKAQDLQKKGMKAQVYRL